MHGDEKFIKVITQADDRIVRLHYSAQAPSEEKGQQNVSVMRTIRRGDLQSAHEYRWVYNNDAPDN